MTLSPAIVGSAAPKNLSFNRQSWLKATIALLLMTQFLMVFTKAFNWDEYLHFGLVYQLREGTLASPFQTLLARLLVWAPQLSDDLIHQMLAARLFVWSAFLVGLFALNGLARQFVAREDALLAVLAYLGAGFVFMHGFAIRTDPIAMALLMVALYLVASQPITPRTVLLSGALIGFAGMLTVKSLFYAPCFAGIAWLAAGRTTDRQAALLRLAAIVPVAAVTYIAVYLAHRVGLAEVSPDLDLQGFAANGTNWLTDGILRQPVHTLTGLLTAPVALVALLLALRQWCDPDIDRDRLIAFVGLCLPLVSVLFYRNVFPYFFVFLLAPMSVALVPSLVAMRRRYGARTLAAASLLVPVSLVVMEPRDELPRQRAIVDYAHRQLAPGAASLDYAGMIADRPRVLNHLLSGIGLRNYRARGIPEVAKAVADGRLMLVIANRPVIADVLSGQSGEAGLLPADAKALQSHFAHLTGPIWLAGKTIPSGSGPFDFEIAADGTYVASGPVEVDGVIYQRGDTMELATGPHWARSYAPAETVLWRGNRLPAKAPMLVSGPLFTRF